MHTSGCKGIEINIQDQEFIIFLILFAILYADDSLVLSDNPKDFQHMLNTFNDYCIKWKLKINTDKTKAMITTRWDLGNCNAVSVIILQASVLPAP